MSEAKPFQAATVGAALRAFGANGRRRFLVADEVGLGKTVVARDIVAALAKRARKQLVVYYIANGGAVAAQNKARLVGFLPKDERGKAIATPDRLSLVAVTPPPKNASVAVYALTPETSFPGVKARLTGGRALERAYVAVLLAKAYPAVVAALPLNLFQLDARSGWWSALEKARNAGAQPGLTARFRQALALEFSGEGEPLLNSRKLKAQMVAEAEAAPRRFIGRLRRALCLACLSHQPPDLVILDEFQRYRDLIGDAGLGDPLMRALLTARAKPPALLLLSATPYRLYATRWEESRGAAAHRELFHLLGFLGGPEVEAEAEGLFKVFGEALRRLASEARLPSGDVVAAAAEAAKVRRRLRTLLAPLVGRTEREAFSAAADSLEPQVRGLAADVRPGDIAVYRHLVRGVEPRHRSDAIAYWSSVPLPAQALGHRYAISRGRTFPRAKGVASLTKGARDRLAQLDLPDAKLRALSTAAPAEQLALPWVGPSVPWWPPRGAWEIPSDPKLLMFSRFKATPPAVASLLSYGVESERVQTRGGYEKAYGRRRLKLSDTPNPVMAAFHPCPWLIRHTDPLQALAGGRSRAAVRGHMRGQVVAALKELGVRVDHTTAAKRRRRRPIGRLIPALEQAAAQAAVSAAAWAAVTGHDRKAAEAVKAWRTTPPLTSVSRREVVDLAEFALSAPGIILGRALWRHAPDALDPRNFGELVRLSWQGLRVYLDNPVLLQTRGKQTAVEAILEAVFDGGLESVLDEHLWMRSQIHSGAAALAADLQEALTLITGGFNFHALGSGERIRLRAHAVVAFGDAEASPGEDARPARPDEVRRSFNSPFWPHVLATTSVGQEGLDFHPWCSRVLHWDLPSNPLDLEQREGRIQRFAGLAIRRQLGALLGPDALAADMELGRSPWMRLATLAEAKYSDSSGLSPWWILPGAVIKRHVFERPFGRDEGRFRMLKEQRLIYRLALGQPNQEDLLELLAQSGPDLLPILRNLTLDLCPFEREATQGQIVRDATVKVAAE